jgi:D-alanyl-D-alanine carboxypeptidase
MAFGVFLFYMRAMVSVGFLLLLGGIFLIVGSWFDKEQSGGNMLIESPATLERTPPSISADSWLVFDMGTGEHILGRHEKQVLPIASVTKLMTAESAYTHFDMGTTTRISWGAVSAEGRAGRLKAGETTTLHELLFPLLLESSNDAAEALSEYRGRGSFLTFMNVKAESLEMRNTHFADPSGLSPQNTSTAEDLSLLLIHLYHHDAHILDITTLKSYIGANHDWLNNNPLVLSPGYRGGKHGYTEEANRTFAGVFEQTFSDGRTRPVGIVVLGSSDIKRDVETLRLYLEAVPTSGG